MKTKQSRSRRIASIYTGANHATPTSDKKTVAASQPKSAIPDVSPQVNHVVETVFMDIHDVLSVHGVLATHLGISTHDIIALFDNFETMKWDTSKRHGPLMALLTTGLIRARSRS